jgi:predicted GNAT family acetyltransferase
MIEASLEQGDRGAPQPSASGCIAKFTQQELARARQGVARGTLTHSPTGAVLMFNVVLTSAGAAVEDDERYFFTELTTVMEIFETLVPAAARGKGVAQLLAEQAFQLAREEAWAVRPSCSYISQTFLARCPHLWEGVEHASTEAGRAAACVRLELKRNRKAELQALCAGAQLSPAGPKPALIERLAAHREANIGIQCMARPVNSASVSSPAPAPAPAPASLETATASSAAAAAGRGIDRGSPKRRKLHGDVGEASSSAADS